ncbi:MAG: hypothetical protein JWO86_7343 [Myxococcaceae bacterium]|nr:hypothetical protein [Myxococcaceae bacterium]
MTGLTDRSGESTSLAACQKDAIAPTRAGIAVHVVCAVARELGQAVKGVSGKPAVHGNLAPENVVLGYDGTIALADAAAPSRRIEASRAKPAYLAPEQVSGSDVDRRADVFSLGVVLWELLTGTSLFARETASETRIAIVDDPILDVRDVNPDVPPIVADVLATALQRDRNARFDTPEAFGKALAGAASSSGIPDPSKQELGAWVAERVPRRRSAPPRPGGARPANASTSAAAPAPVPAPPPAPVVVPDFDVPGASRASRSFPTLDAVKAPSAPDLGPSSIPAFDTSAMAAAALAPSTRPPPMSAPPSSGRGSAPVLPAPALGTSVRASTPSVPTQQPGGGRSIAFDGGDDDEFDMEIERNVAGTSLPTAQSSRSSGTHAAPRASGGHRVAGTGLELAAPSRMAREASARDEEYSEPGFGMKALGLALATIIGGGTAVALWKYANYVHHAGGFDVTRAMPHAFDGTSATESGAISLASLVLALIVGFVGLRFKPHAWAVVAAGGTLLLLALAMVTVTLASTGENPTPPDGALLVPYLFPAAVLMVAIGVNGRAARLFAVGHGARRVAFVPLAAIAGAIAFFAFEASRLAR